MSNEEDWKKEKQELFLVNEIPNFTKGDMEKNFFYCDFAENHTELIINKNKNSFTTDKHFKKFRTCKDVRTYKRFIIEFILKYRCSVQSMAFLKFFLLTRKYKIKISMPTTDYSISKVHEYSYMDVFGGLSFIDMSITSHLDTFVEYNDGVELSSATMGFNQTTGDVAWVEDGSPVDIIRNDYVYTDIYGRFPFDRALYYKGSYPNNDMEMFKKHCVLENNAKLYAHFTDKSKSLLKLFNEESQKYTGMLRRNEYDDMGMTSALLCYVRKYGSFRQRKMIWMYLKFRDAGKKVVHGNGYMACDYVVDIHTIKYSCAIIIEYKENALGKLGNFYVMYNIQGSYVNVMAQDYESAIKLAMERNFDNKYKGTDNYVSDETVEEICEGNV